MVDSILNLDSSYILGLIAIFLILTVISFIIKAIKTTIFLIIVGILMTGICTNVVSLKEQYNIQLEGTEVSYILDGTTNTIDIDDIDSIDIKNETENGLLVTINSNDDTFDIEVPNILYEIISISK